MTFITVLQNTENARASGKFKGLILASAIMYEIFAAGFYLRYVFFWAVSKQITQDLLSLIPTTE